MQLNEIMLDQNLKELTKRGSPSFPIEMYDNDFGKLISGEFPWHWHYEVEFVFMLEGSVCAETQNDNYSVRMMRFFSTVGRFILCVLRRKGYAAQRFLFLIHR